VFQFISWSAPVVWLIVVFATSGSTAAARDTHGRFEVHDSIEMARFVEPGIMSPDERFLATVTERGLLAQNVTEGTIWLFDSRAVRQAVNQPKAVAAITPVAIARLSASINGGNGAGHGHIIMRLVWEAGGNSLLFLGRDGQENRQLFRVSVSDRKVKALSLPTQDVIDYASAGSHIAYLAGPGVSPEKAWWSNDPSAPDIVVGNGRSFWELLYPNYQQNARYMPTEFEVWQAEGAAAPRPIIEGTTGKPMHILGSHNVGAIGLSHDGSQLIALAHADRIPPLWERYEVPSDLNGIPYRADPPTGDGSIVPLSRRESDFTRAVQYQVIDLKKGTHRPLLEAPAADFLRGGVDEAEPAWSPDDHYVAVAGTFLPLDPQPGAAGSTRICGVAVINVDGAHVDCLVDHGNPRVAPVMGLAWDREGTGLFIQSTGSPEVEYEWRGNRWKPTQRHPRARTPLLELTVQQDLNNPPALFASDRRAGKGLKIFDPNPQLKSIELGTVSVYTWKDPRGRSAEGGLAKPPDFAPGHRYPLVIQTHGFPSNQFFRVGYGSETANAGRALAGRGMLVLQVREPHTDSVGTWREGTERGTEVYLAAIDQLAQEGLVDSTKVGITGYSRSGFFVSKAITEAPERFAAAVVANADPGSVFGYYTYIDYELPNSAKRAADVFAGSSPYGEGLQNWIERSPGFNTDKIRAPVLISAGDPQHLISLWSLYAPLRDQHKPVELQYIRNGQHNFTKPLEVFAHQEMLVDWFDFWLNDHEAAAPEKAEQYARWREMKKSLESKSAREAAQPPTLAH
jgi:hypothetical protein